MKFTFKSIITPMAMIVASAQGFLPSKETVVTTVGAGLATAGYALDKYVLPEKAAYATTVLGGLGLAAHMKYGTGHGNSVTVPALQYGTLPYLTYKAVNKVMPENWAYAKTAAGIFGAAEAAYVGFKRLNRPYTIDEVYAAAGPAMNTEKRAAVKGMYNTLPEADKKAYDNKYGNTASVAFYEDPKTSAELLKLAQDKLSGLEVQLKKAIEEKKDVVELNKQIEAAKVELQQAEYNNANVIDKTWTNIKNNPWKTFGAVALATVGTGLLITDLRYNRNIEKGEWFGSLSNTYTAAPFLKAYGWMKGGYDAVRNKVVEGARYVAGVEALEDEIRASNGLLDSFGNQITSLAKETESLENVIAGNIKDNNALKIQNSDLASQLTSSTAQVRSLESAVNQGTRVNQGLMGENAALKAGLQSLNNDKSQLANALKSSHIEADALKNVVKKATDANVILMGKNADLKNDVRNWFEVATSMNDVIDRTLDEVECSKNMVEGVKSLFKKEEATSRAAQELAFKLNKSNGDLASKVQSLMNDNSNLKLENAQLLNQTANIASMFENQ